LKKAETIGLKNRFILKNYWVADYNDDDDDDDVDDNNNNL